jgi:hypothetical protein
MNNNDLANAVIEYLNANHKYESAKYKAHNAVASGSFYLDSIDLNDLGDLARQQEILRQKIGTIAKQILA